MSRTCGVKAARVAARSSACTRCRRLPRILARSAAQRTARSLAAESSMPTTTGAVCRSCSPLRWSTVKRSTMGRSTMGLCCPTMGRFLTDGCGGALRLGTGGIAARLPEVPGCWAERPPLSGSAQCDDRDGADALGLGGVVGEPRHAPRLFGVELVAGAALDLGDGDRVALGAAFDLGRTGGHQVVVPVGVGGRARLAGEDVD